MANSRIKNLSINSSFVLFGVLLFLIGFEIFLRFVVPHTPHSTYLRADRETGRSLRPNCEVPFVSLEYDTTIRINSLGMRGPEPMPGEGTPVLGLGDSHAFGQGVEYEETYLSVLKQLLARQDYPLSVYNAAIPATSTDTALLLLRKHAPSLHPRLVLLGYTIGNDTLGNGQVQLKHSEGGLVQIRPTPITHKRSLPVQWGLKLIPRTTLFTGQVIKGSPFFLSLKKKLGWGRLPRELKQFITPALPFWERAWKQTDWLLEKLDEEVRGFGAELTVVAIPTIYQVEREKFAPLFKEYGDGFDLDLPNRKLKAICQKHEIPFLDLMPGMRERWLASEEEFFYPRDHHMNVQGHAFTAELLHSFVDGHGFLPPHSQPIKPEITSP